MSLIHNERIKLLAVALNTAATSSFAIGVLAPMAAAFYNFGANSPLKLGTLSWVRSFGFQQQLPYI
jgi:hypothetical protein